MPSNVSSRRLLVASVVLACSQISLQVDAFALFAVSIRPHNWASRRQLFNKLRYMCEGCGSAFATWQERSKHFKTAHPEFPINRVPDPETPSKGDNHEEQKPHSHSNGSHDDEDDKYLQTVDSADDDEEELQTVDSAHDDEELHRSREGKIKELMLRTLRAMHHRPKPKLRYMCEGCGSAFATWQERSKHFKTAHPEFPINRVPDPETPSKGDNHEEQKPHSHSNGSHDDEDDKDLQTVDSADDEELQTVDSADDDEELHRSREDKIKELMHRTPRTIHHRPKPKLPYLCECGSAFATWQERSKHFKTAHPEFPITVDSADDDDDDDEEFLTVDSADDDDDELQTVGSAHDDEELQTVDPAHDDEELHRSREDKIKELMHHTLRTMHHGIGSLRKERNHSDQRLPRGNNDATLQKY